MRLGRRPGSNQGKGRVWEKSNAVQRSAAEAVTKIRVKVEAEKEKRDKAYAKARAKVEADIMGQVQTKEGHIHCQDC